MESKKPDTLQQLRQESEAAVQAGEKKLDSSDKSRAFVYDLVSDYTTEKGSLTTSPYWILAVIRLGSPITFFRKDFSSIGNVVTGALSRKESPLIITDDCLQLSITSSKKSHVKTLNAILKQGKTNYLSGDAMLPGDWLMAWIVNNQTDYVNLLNSIANSSQSNEFKSGLKFVGRVHSIRKTVRVDGSSGLRTANYTLQGASFGELDTQFFYDTNLAHDNLGDISDFMSQMGWDINKLFNQTQKNAGRVKDNVADVLEALFNGILGKGLPRVNQAAESRENKKEGRSAAPKPSPQFGKEAPYAYLVPTSVGTLLGLNTQEMSKANGQVFGYTDICETLIGVQKYEVSSKFYPVLNEQRSKGPRKFTSEVLKGTIIPIEPSFINRPLWQIMESYTNTSINEMYTTLKPNPQGNLMPTLVARQIPFSTDSIPENKTFPLTRFLSLPRWKLDPSLIYSVDLGRSNATRVNMVHIYGTAQAYKENVSITHQILLNPPVFDTTDIARSGIKSIMRTVSCGITDQFATPKLWMRAVSDWTFGSHLTLNGTIESVGIQAPICEGDNIEFEGAAYHVESVVHSCSINPTGTKTFKTTLELSYGMPVDQGRDVSYLPKYPGLSRAGDGDDSFGVTQDPGQTVDNSTQLQKTKK
jgi:hypothetical protein